MAISNSADAFRLQYKMLKLTAAWPEEQPTLFYRIQSVASLILTCVLGVTMFMEAYSELDNFAALSEVLYILITVVVYNIKYGNFFVQRRTFLRMMKLLKHPTFLSYPDDLDYLMIKRIKSSRLLTQLFRFFVLTCVFLMCISPFIEHHPLPYPFPYDLGPYTPLMYCFQVVSILVVAWNDLCYDSLAASLIGIAITHLEILAQRISRIKDQRRSEEEFSEDLEVVEGLKICLKYHTAIIEFVECIDQVFSFSTFSQFLGSAIIICNTLFYFVLTSVGSSQFFMLINYIAVVFAELFMYCWFGNEILWKSISVGEACYSSNWYKCNKKVNQCLFIIMERSRRPLKITASKISTLSLAAFTSIMQWSYSYFALLMKLYMKQRQNRGK